MKLVKDNITVAELKEMSEKMFHKVVKAVVDIEQEVMVVDAEMHSDEELLLLENGSAQDNLWGINFHPHIFPEEEWIEFDSMINIRPGLNNRSRYVHSPELRKKIITIANKLVVK